jgi:putative ATP-dependent endonuclease of OLD family
MLDLDSGRHSGGWGRVRNAFKQVNKVKPNTFAEEDVEALPKWDDDCDFPQLGDPKPSDGDSAIASLEKHGTFFSYPVDLDLMMLQAYPAAYDVKAAEPDESTVIAVLGKKHANELQLGSNVLSLFDDYHAKFDLKSKPATHLSALASLTNPELMVALPDVLSRLVRRIKELLAELPE